VTHRRDARRMAAAFAGKGDHPSTEPSSSPSTPAPGRASPADRGHRDPRNSRRHLTCRHRR
jgi:hypothetical protein